MAAHVSSQVAAWGEPTAATKAIWKQAESDLLIALGAGKSDLVVWEHSIRVVGVSLQMLALPDLAGQRIDRNALVAAGLYHDAGWSFQARKQQIPCAEVLTRPTTDAQRELSATLLEQAASRLLPEATLRAAARAIREAGRRDTQMAEACVLAEADNLDQIGPQAVWLTMRRSTTDARGIDAVLDAWRRQREYRYWEARLRECFRYETTRRLARQRLEAVERMMNDLARAHRLEDVAEFLAGADANPRSANQPSA
jgi:HD superfamily phosphodiesterase